MSDPQDRVYFADLRNGYSLMYWGTTGNFQARILYRGWEVSHTTRPYDTIANLWAGARETIDKGYDDGNNQLDD